VGAYLRTIWHRAWALGGAITLKLGVPAVLVRQVPKTYFVSCGDDPAFGGGRLAGERLPHGTPIHLIDDLVRLCINQSPELISQPGGCLETVVQRRCSGRSALWSPDQD
jgi:hypothetical protein